MRHELCHINQKICHTELSKTAIFVNINKKDDEISIDLLGKSTEVREPGILLWYTFKQTHFCQHQKLNWNSGLKISRDYARTESVCGWKSDGSTGWRRVFEVTLENHGRRKVDRKYFQVDNKSFKLSKNLHYQNFRKSIINARKYFIRA